MVFVESAEILREHIKRLSCGAHGAAIGAVAMGRAQDVWPGLVNFSVDGVCRWPRCIFA